MYTTSHSRTIESGQTTHSYRIDCSHASQIAVKVPAGFTGSTLFFQSSPTPDSPIDVAPALSLVVTAGQMAVLDDALTQQFRSLRYVWFKAGEAQAADAIMDFVLTKG